MPMADFCGQTTTKKLTQGLPEHASAWVHATLHSQWRWSLESEWLSLKFLVRTASVFADESVATA